MTQSQNIVHFEEVDFEAGHTIFIEGTNDSLDYLVVKKFLVPQAAVVKPMGSAADLRRVAKLMYEYRPKDYFLVDRDHYSDETVNRSWSTFPSNNTENLLFWKKKEIENYLIDPRFLMKSKYFNKNKVSELHHKITEIIKNNYLIDAANYSIRSVVRSKIPDFNSMTIPYFDTSISYSDVASLIQSQNELINFIDNANYKGILDNIIAKFKEKVDELSQEIDNKRYFSDIMMKNVGGKSILEKVVNPPFFVVKPKMKHKPPLQGIKCLHRVIEDILRENENNLPNDFIELKKVISDKINYHST